MNILQKTQIIAQIISAVALVVTLTIYYLQLRTMGKQLAAMRQGTDAQHILSLLSFIESEEVRTARQLVYTRLHRKQVNEWTESELQAASRVCASFATIGRLLKSGIVPIEPIVEGWEPSLWRSYQILEPFILVMRKPENGGPQYWIGFDWLCGELDRVGAVERHTQNLRRARRGSHIGARFRHLMTEGKHVV
jgi:hypothetical protein